jgi:hypothetical protein
MFTALRNTVLAAIATALPSMADVANAATPVTGSTAVHVGAVTGGSNGTLTSVNLLGTFDFIVSVGGSTTPQNFLSLTMGGRNNNSYMSSVTDTLTFIGPGSGTFVDTGTVDFSVLGNKFTGSVTWDDGASGEDVTLSDGSIVNINLADIFFTNTQNTTQTITGVLKLVSGPTANIPEPASMTALGVGLFGLGFMRRRRIGLSSRA